MRPVLPILFSHRLLRSLFLSKRQRVGAPGAAASLCSSAPKMPQSGVRPGKQFTPVARCQTPPPPVVALPMSFGQTCTPLGKPLSARAPSVFLANPECQFWAPFGRRKWPRKIPSRNVIFGVFSQFQFLSVSFSRKFSGKSRKFSMFFIFSKKKLNLSKILRTRM